MWNTQPPWAVAMEKRIMAAIKKEGDWEMGNTNQSAANLAAEESKIEGLVQTLGTTQATAFTDLKAEINNLLAAPGVPQAQVDAVTAKMNAFEATITGLTTIAQSADPGTQAAPPSNTPAGS